jgi:hypothetical protein
MDEPKGFPFRVDATNVCVRPAAYCAAVSSYDGDLSIYTKSEREADRQCEEARLQFIAFTRDNFSGSLEELDRWDILMCFGVLVDGAYHPVSMHDKLHGRVGQPFLSIKVQ